MLLSLESVTKAELVSLDELKVTLYDLEQQLVVDVLNVAECS